METSMKVQRLRAKKFNTKNRSDVAKPISTQQKLKKLKIVLSENVRDYCENSSVHGLKYVVNKSLYPFERLFFAISFICVVIGTVYFVAKIYEKWNYTPMLVSINPKLSRITDEPFPAVTICNLNQAYKAKAEQFSVYSLEHTILQMICKLDVNVTIAEAITVTDWNNLKNFIYGISQPCFNMLLQCKYGNTFFNCSEIFRPIITNNGLCCTFNMVHPKIMYREMVIKVPSAQNYRYPIGYETIDWSTENGFPADLPKKFIPMKALGIGEGQGLSLILDVERDEYYCSSSNGIGFKILLHNPLEAPNMREIGLLLAPGRETKINIHADKVESEQYVRSVSKASRKCLFEDEQILKIYKKYTQRNCIEECSVFTWLGICGCLPYFKPMPYGNETICDMLDFTCVERVRLRTMLYDKAGKSCANTCIPGCNDINYLPSLTSAPLIQTGFPTQSEVAKNISNGYLKKNLAVVKIYFKESTYGGAKNSDFIRAPDFLSNIGGIIGLFFGVSFISLAELIFYCIWRPVRMLVATRKLGNARSAKLRKSKSIRLLFTKQSIHNNDTLQQRNSYNQNFPQRSKAWEAVAVKQDTPWNGIQSSKLAWQPGMEYTP